MTLASVNVGQRQWRTAGFAQDNFKVLPNLTLVFGVRYEYDEPWVEEQDRTGNINLTTGQIDYAGHLPAGALARGGNLQQPGLLPAEFPAVDAAPGICLSSDRSLCCPRRLWRQQLL